MTASSTFRRAMAVISLGSFVIALVMGSLAFFSYSDQPLYDERQYRVLAQVTALDQPAGEDGGFTINVPGHGLHQMRTEHDLPHLGQQIMVSYDPDHPQEMHLDSSPRTALVVPALVAMAASLAVSVLAARWLLRWSRQQPAALMHVDSPDQTSSHS